MLKKAMLLDDRTAQQGALDDPYLKTALGSYGALCGSGQSSGPRVIGASRSICYCQYATPVAQWTDFGRGGCNFGMVAAHFRCHAFGDKLL